MFACGIRKIRLNSILILITVYLICYAVWLKKNNNLYQNCFLILAILNKIFFDLGISEYIMIYESENIIQICKEKNN